MDELMTRFVLNLKRDEDQLIFDENRKLLEKPNLRFEKDEEIKESVENSLNALKNLM